MTKTGTTYSFNSKGWKKNNEEIKDACYVPASVARKAMEIYNNSRQKGNTEGIIGKIFDRCKEIKYGERGGVILYEDAGGRLMLSSEVVSKQPEFQSLEDNVLDWLEGAMPEEERRDKVQIDRENKPEKGKDGTSSGTKSGTIGFKED